VPVRTGYKEHPLYGWIVIWALVSPLLWTFPGMPGFVTLTLAANSAQVMLLPVLAGGVWWITASSKYIGGEYKCRWWENLLMALMFSLAVYGGIHSAALLLGFSGVR